MLIKKGQYKDTVAQLIYNLKSEINLNQEGNFILVGENGVGKSRFIEGILLKEIKKSGSKLLYFSQDIENQILSFELISLVKTFIDNLRREKSFFKTIFLNDETHNTTELNFSEKSTLRPDNTDIKNFIIKECKSYNDLDTIIFDEVDKYFDSEEEFLRFLDELPIKNIILISHIIGHRNLKDFKSIRLIKNTGVIDIEIVNS